MMKNVLLLLADGYETYEASVFIDVIGWNLIDGDKSTKLFSCGLKKEVSSSFNQKCIVDYLVDDINVDDYDALAIPGGFEEFEFYKEAYDEKFLNVIRGFQKQNKLIASICVAALSLGKSGILNGRFATTYNKKSIRQDTLKKYGINVKNEPVVIDGNVMTCWNPSTAIDVAFLLLERLTTKENTNYIKSIMGFDDKIK
ncbi:MAG: DJ-1/PfpI family protein [Desulfobacula sp.]|uniref:DJ-1/PfpI family protein n=1 Tax=Desulfobacula sp. TaxID=2593537 RepID=UPI0025BE81F6|nr:DJ-1/PfpI family protein [Desulfobacula sp.]MCD4722437.1 DJ-1/PfpI family protein [Desulfobacula sp.]